MKQLLIGIDIGTGSSKGVLTDANGEIIATASVQHEISLPRPGWAEADADSMWWKETISISQQLMQHAGDSNIAGVCVSGMGPCLLLTDTNSTPLRPAILYGIDMRATAEIVELTEKFGNEQIIKRCGTALSTQAVGPKMLWAARNEPQVWAKSRKWFNSNSYIVSRLTGAYVLDHHSASQCDPLYDLENQTWFDEWVQEICPDLEMPELLWPHEIAGAVNQDAANATGLPVGTPVVTGTIDAWAEAFSAGVRKSGDLMLMYGSTMFMVQVLPALSTSPLLWTTTGVERNTFTFAAGMATSGSLTSWMKNIFGGVTFEDLVQEAASTPPGADGLLLLPYFAGERTPVFDPQARGVIAGLSLRHTRGHIFRATYEGIGFGIRQILDLFDAAGGKEASRIVAVGGGTQGGLWTQIVSDITGRSQLIPKKTIGASYGDSLLAGIGTGLLEPNTDWAEISHEVVPNPETFDTYQLLFQQYQELYTQTKSQVHILAGIQEKDGSPN
jgi:xylulokinase